MSELLEEALQFYNLPLSVSFGLVVIYWLLAVIGVLDTDALEPDVDLDIDSDTDLIGGPAMGTGLGRFFNLGDIPIVVFLSVLVSLLWAGAILGNHYLNPSGSYLLAFGLFAVNLVVSLMLTKLLTTPLKPVMRALRAGEKHRPVVGRSCIIKTNEVTESFGQAEAEDKSGNPLLIHVRVSPGQEPLAKGDEAIVIERLEEDQVYLVRKI